MLAKRITVGRASIYSLGKIASWGVCVAACLCLVGCNSDSTPKSDASLQKKLFVTAKPESINSIKSVYDAFQADQKVTVAGLIYADGMNPFDPKQSVFTIVDLPKNRHEHEDPGDCPFCRHQLKSAKIAIVQVSDDSGKPLSQSAETLLGLKKNQEIAVSGPVSQIGDTVFIKLESLYVLSKEDADSLTQAFYAEDPAVKTEDAEK